MGNTVCGIENRRKDISTYLLSEPAFQCEYISVYKRLRSVAAQCANCIKISRSVFFPGVSHLFPSRSQVRPARPGYTSTRRRKAIPFGVQGALMAGFQSTFSPRHITEAEESSHAPGSSDRVHGHAVPSASAFYAREAGWSTNSDGKGASLVDTRCVSSG